jgi:dienelactone hydrolase
MKLGLSVATLLTLAAMSRAAIHTETVAYKHGDTELEGFLAYDDAQPGKRPGVLVVHEWLGLNNHAKKRAEMLARLGYVAFALDMYGKGVRGTSPQDGPKLSAPYKANRDLMRARAAAGLAVLRGHGRVDPAKVAAIGYCFGGTTALELARSGANLAGVVSFHGNLETPLPAQKGQMKAKVLVCHGADDPFVPTQEVLTFEDQMRKAGADWQFIAFGGCGTASPTPAPDRTSRAASLIALKRTGGPGKRCAISSQRSLGGDVPKHAAEVSHPRWRHWERTVSQLDHHAELPILACSE